MIYFYKLLKVTNHEHNNEFALLFEEAKGLLGRFCSYLRITINSRRVEFSILKALILISMLTVGSH
jgi:hypothetical protein